LIELVKVFFKFFLKIKDITTKSTRGINTFPSFDLKLSSLPISDDFFFEISFQLKLFVSRFSDFFNFFSKLKKGTLEELRKGELFTFIWNFLFDQLNNFIPMTITNRRFSQGLDQRKNFSVIINLLLELFISFPRFKNTR